ncbi:hypothetical protein ACGC1H_002210 [Rhizoctonia solani]|uniref:SWR1-complex protein 5 n=1 Tax=Rhizoctonia solani TaxID=456999 RepID=A0A8H2X4M0_9AGAM|nr:unnamed protein product [Rhizoctonia solani]
MPEFPTLNSAILDSDEDDNDYVPGEKDSDSESDGGPETKKPRTGDTLDMPATKPLADDAARNALWNSFLKSTQPETTESKISTSKFDVQTITIERKYRFAGEDVIEKVAVPEDSPEAQEWRKRQLIGGQSTSSIATPIVLTPGSGSSTPNTSPLHPPEMNVVKTPPTKPKPPPKSRKSLSSLAAAGKPKKLTTLDKSRLDWQSHLVSSTQEERDDLERNRKAGGAGYLEKVDFLARVGERRDNVFEDSKRKRR